MNSSSDPRHNSRILVLQQLFEKDFKTNQDLISESESFSIEALEEADEMEGDFDSALATSLFEGIVAKQAELDALIRKLAPEWPLESISKIDLNLLRLAIAEGFLLKLTPQKVVINEAIELSKEFSNDQSRKFISGVLGNLYEHQKKYIS